MKITVKQYAQSLYEAVKDKKDSQLRDVVKIFFGVLMANNDVARFDKISMEFEKIWNRENGIVEAQAVSAKKLDKNIIKLLNSYIARLTGARTVILDSAVDKDILGGIVLKYGDKVLDGSLKSRLAELKIGMMK